MEAPIIARRSENEFIPAPAGTHAAVCVDVVDLGMIEGFSGKPQHKIRVVWQLAEKMLDGRPFVVQRRYTLSLHEKSALCQDLESWRGRLFTKEELKGFHVQTIIGAPCLLSIIHTSRDGKVWADVNSVMKLPKGVITPKPEGYVRVKDRQATGRPNGAPQEPANAAGIDDDACREAGL